MNATPQTQQNLKMSIEFEARLRNVTALFVSKRNSLHAEQIFGINENDLPSPLKLCHVVDTPRTLGDGNDGQCCLAEGSRARLVGYRPKIATQAASRYTGLALDRQHKLGRNTAFGFGEPVPDLSLRRADPVGQTLLATSSFARKFERFFLGHGITLPIFRWIST
jgi:hypothetical protein